MCTQKVLLALVADCETVYRDSISRNRIGIRMRLTLRRDDVSILMGNYIQGKRLSHR